MDVAIKNYAPATHKSTRGTQKRAICGGHPLRQPKYPLESIGWGSNRRAWKNGFDKIARSDFGRPQAGGGAARQAQGEPSNPTLLPAQYPLESNSYDFAPLRVGDQASLLRAMGHRTATAQPSGVCNRDLRALARAREFRCGSRRAAAGPRGRGSFNRAACLRSGTACDRC